MLSVVIYDSDPKIVEYLTATIKNHITIEDIHGVKVELVTTDSKDVLDLFMKTEILPSGTAKVIKKSLKNRLLLLELDSDSGDGLTLAKEIREYDIHSNIAFITNPLSSEREIVNSKVTALGYLYKGLGQQKMYESTVDILETAVKRLHMPSLPVHLVEIPTSRGTNMWFNLDDICYVQGNEVKDKSESEIQSLSILYTINGLEPLSRKLRTYEKQLPYLIRAGRSYLVNPGNVESTHITSTKARLLMKNGEEIRIDRTSFDKYHQTLKKIQMSE